MSLKILKNFVILLIELTLLFSLLHQFLHSFELIMLQMLDLLVQTDIIDSRAYGLSRSGAESHNFHSSARDFFSKLIHSNVRWGTNKNFANLLLDQMVHQGSRSHCLSSAWWPLNECQGGSESLLHSIHLEVIELRHSLN